MEKGIETGGKALLQTWVPRDLKERWKTVADANGMTLSAFQEAVMREALDGRKMDAGLPEKSREAKSGKLHIKLRPDEIEGVRLAAKREGHSLSGWVAMLIRARLRAAPSFTGTEVAALLTAATQLMAIGRNINAAVRRLHSEGRWDQRNQPMLAALEKCREVEGLIHRLLESARRRSAF